MNSRTGKISLILLSLFITVNAVAQEKYAVIKMKGVINRIKADHLRETLKSVTGDPSYQFLIIQLDTPGGTLSDTRDIVQMILVAGVPVIVYTYPKGARAASAGGFIMLSAHVAAMAPGSEIGAMHPVGGGLDFKKKDKQGKPEGVPEQKILNDTISFGKSIAQDRKRNVRWVINAIREAQSSTYKEALAAGVIDLVADDMPELLRKIDGRVVTIKGKKLKLSASGLQKVEFAMNTKQEIFDFIANPQLYMIFFIIAVIGLGIEFKAPGMIVPGVIGAVSLLMFLLASQILPINGLGILLIILAVVLFILELNVVSYGLLTVGGITAFVFGSLILFDSPLPGVKVPVSFIITALLFILGFVFVVLRAVVNVHRTKVTTGQEGLVGEKGTALRDFDGKGKIRVHGEIWNAVSEDEIRKDQAVEVLTVDGMTLHVKRL